MIKLKLILISLLLTQLPAIARAQTPKKETTATVSGIVTLNGAAVRNVVVSLAPQNQSGQQQPMRIKTDTEGHFRFTDVVAGQYVVGALTPGFYSTNDNQYGSDLPGKVLNVASGETIENIELQLKRGAVITGSVMDENNEPIVETSVQLTRVGDRLRVSQSRSNYDSYQTDDRGVYRIYGLPPGKYQVSVGVPMKGGSPTTQRMRAFIEQTFHPDTTDQVKAKVIELEEGQTASDVDIRIGKMKSAYEVSGRVIDSQTGQPVVGVNLSLSQIQPSTGKFSGWTVSGGTSTDTNGEFHLLGLRSGKLGLFIRNSGERNEYYSDPVTIEITNRDLSGVEIRAQRGATINGWVIIEGTNDPAILAKRSQIRLGALTEDNPISNYAVSTQVKTDASFRLVGVPSGKTRLRAFGDLSWLSSGLSLVRIEQNGVPVKDDTLQTRAGEQINNVRVVFAYSTAAIRGRLVFTGGEAPEKIIVRAFAKQSGSHTDDKSAQVDAHGYFVIEGLLPGEYLVRLSANSYGAITAETVTIVGRIAESSQRVTLTSSTQAQVTFTIDLTPEGKKQ